jgi:2-polyprenyl-6-methoxyphenol hydroxylase-like FAD-dependent oxidoreductase
MAGLKILIVGAGLGGLALAGFLDDCDIEYSIIEKCPEWRHEGFALGLWNNGRHILRKLGLSHWVDENEIAFQSVVICDGKGNKLRSYNLGRFYSEFGMAYSHVRRADLHQWLLGRIARKVRMGTWLTSLHETEDAVSVQLADGTEEHFDLVVAADGVHSTVRGCCFAGDLEWYTDWRAWYVWVDRSFAGPRTVSQYVAPRECIAVFDEGDKALVVLIAKSDHSIWDDAQHRVDRLKLLFKEELALMPQCLAKAVSEEICPTDLIEISLKRWHTGRVVLIGDAAHGFEPFGGLGGSMALEDAYVLASQLAKMSQNDPKELYVALDRYETIRKRRVRDARRLTQRMQCWATIESPFWRQVVNQLAPIVPESWITRGYFAFMRHEM